MLPAAGNSAKVCVERQQSAEYERLCHYLVDGWPSARVEMQHVKNELS